MSNKEDWTIYVHKNRPEDLKSLQKNNPDEKIAESYATEFSVDGKQFGKLSVVFEKWLGKKEHNIIKDNVVNMGHRTLSLIKKYGITAPNNLGGYSNKELNGVPQLKFPVKYINYD